MAKELTADQQRVLDVLARNVITGRDGMAHGIDLRRTVRGTDDDVEKQRIVESLCPRFAKRHNGKPPEDYYELTLEGLLASEEGSPASIWIQALLKFLREKFQKEGAFLNYKWSELLDKLEFNGWRPTEDRFKFARAVIHVAGLSEWAGPDEPGEGAKDFLWARPQDVEQLRKIEFPGQLVQLRKQQAEASAREAESKLHPNDLARRILAVFFEKYRESGRRNWWAAPESPVFDRTGLSIAGRIAGIQRLLDLHLLRPCGTGYRATLTVAGVNVMAHRGELDQALPLSSAESVPPQELVTRTRSDSVANNSDGQRPMALEAAQVERYLERFSSVANSAFPGVVKQLFGYLEKHALDSETFQRYEEERKTKWKEWPGFELTPAREWEMPGDEDEARSLAWDLYRSVAESSDKGDRLLMNLFFEDHSTNVAQFNATFLSHFAEAIEGIVSDVATTPTSEKPASGALGSKVFIGHGRSPVWKDLRELLQDRLHLECVEFNSESAAGKATTQRLSEMLKQASFAFLLLTAEDEHSDGKQHARENVVHEVGLFQGRLGFERAIVLLEEGCAEFSNITGLGQIRFPKGDVMARSEEIRRVLEREKVLEASKSRRPRPRPD